MGANRPMSTARHVMIRASAGSGKTYQLTERVLELIRAGAPPERIVALTFTRKAAGEFFDNILTKAAQAADSPEGLALLRRLLDAMPRLRLGTLDGFFARIVRSFPFELGLTGDFELLQDHSARQERRRVLRRMFTRSQHGLEAAQQDFIEAFKRATLGVEEKRLAGKLDEFIDSHHAVFLTASAEGLWGNRERIWPEGAPWLGAPRELGPQLETLRAWFAAAAIDDKQRGRWRAFCEEVERWAPGMSPPAQLAFVLRKALEAMPGLLLGPTVLKFDRKEQRLTAEAARALAGLALAIVAGEFTRRLAVTQGIRKLLEGYEGFYHDAVRRGGKLTFADVQRLLEAGGMDERRLDLEYRLDGGIDHWLLDEFQDTSFAQWSILQNLVDEAIQDPEGRRTFFCVGDAKQAIYGWREGDHRLFGDILERYNRAVPGTIEQRDLVKSWRSGPAIVSLVNRVFGNKTVLREHFAGPAAEEWISAWQDHVSAKPGVPGQAAALAASDEAGRFEVTTRILMEIRPWERGLTAAVLVRRNETAAALAEHLRREGGIPAMAESDLHVCIDQPVGAALMALVQAAAHPEDEFARQHLRMTPLLAILEKIGWSAPEDLTRGLLAELQSDGFARTLERWLRRLDEAGAMGGEFYRQRALQMVEAAALFDATGGRSAAEFVEFMERYTAREPESAAVVRVMTIHKAKGLGFDVVVVPDIQGNRLAQKRDGLAVQRSRDRRVEWILDLPAKDFWKGDAIIESFVAAEEAAGCYEQLAILYVALTRAKQGLYVVFEPPAPGSTSKNFPCLISETLGTDGVAVAVGGEIFEGVWAQGQARWFERAEIPPPGLMAQGEGRLLGWKAEKGAEGRGALRALRPSGEQRLEFALAGVFHLGGSAAEFGEKVHRDLAAIEWAGPADLAGTPYGGLAEVFARPAGNVEVWRERPFELVDGNQWVSGAFDRVVVQRDAEGRPLSATVYDFKTDQREEAELHRQQMAWYRAAVQRLTGLPESAVRCELVWVRTGRRTAV
jgi:ATP-dependent helicase/nuclease subunit A